MDVGGWRKKHVLNLPLCITSLWPDFKLGNTLKEFSVGFFNPSFFACQRKEKEGGGGKGKMSHFCTLERIALVLNEVPCAGL